MKTNLFNIKHHARQGPGGYRCACCFEAPGKRKHVQRKHKLYVYKLLDRLED